MIDPNIFRAYDIRGVYGENLDSEVVRLIGIVLRELFPKDSFVVGNDVRASSVELANALISGIGGGVTYLGTTAFGETLFAGLKLKKDKTLYVTASHLPPEWNGLKLYYGDGEAFTSELIYKIRDLVVSKQRIDFNETYVSYIKKSFNVSSRLKIVVDCGNGSTCLTAPKIFTNAIIINGEIDPNFSARTSDIEIKDLGVLKEKVLSEKADLGVAFDGDGDRFILVDEKGNFHRSDIIGVVIAKYLLPTSKEKKVVVTLPVSMAVETELKLLGAEIIRVPVGHTFVINGCKNNNALIGMEESGHLVMTDYFLFDDAIIVPLKVAEIMSKTGKKLSELVGEIPNYPFEEIVFDCADGVKFQFIIKLANELSKKYKNVSTIDGLWIQFEDGWILLRASNTSPKIRLYVEATSRTKFDSLKKEFVGIVEERLK